LTFLLLLARPTLVAAGEPPDDGGTKEIGRTTEKEVNVVLSSSFGSVNISRGESGKIVVAEALTKGTEDPKMNIDYDIRNRVGYMDVTLGEHREEGEHKHGSFKIHGFNGGKWFLRFSDAVPISFDVELGVGNGDFDLSGLNVKDFNLSTGASDVSLSFDQPNKSVIDNLNIESGVSKFTGRNLGNANFKRLRFQGGVGAYTLDFNGKLNNEVDVDVEVGLGVLTLIVPEDVGARIYYEKNWISRLDCDRDFHSVADNQYESDNFNSSSGRMNIRIDSGLGSVKIRRR
jgi:hypothetical protein